MYKLLACDVDNTLINKDFVLSETNKQAIRAAQKAGVQVVLCSGRSYVSLKGFAEEIGINRQGGRLIGFNGGIVYDLERDEVVFRRTMSGDVGAAAVRFFTQRRPRAEILIYAGPEHVIYEETSIYASEYRKTSAVQLWEPVKDIAAKAGSLQTMAKIIFLGANEDLEAFRGELEAEFGREAAIFFTADIMLEITSKEINKGDGLMWLCGQLGIPPARVIAIGDNFNDISMLKAAGFGVAVANAVEPAKQAADYITKNDCSNNAVAEVINKFILQNENL